MAITRWEPFADLPSLHNRMNRLFQDYYGELGRGSEQSLAASAFAPRVDVYEDDNHVTLKLEVPGINEKDLNIRLDNNVLSVSGERKFEKDEKEENFHRIERRYGSFTRSFTLPSSIDPDSCSANYDNGVLRIRLAKRPEAKPKNQDRCGLDRIIGKGSIVLISIGSERTARFLWLVGVGRGCLL